MSAAVEALGLSKTYVHSGGKTEALKELSLSVPAGRVYGIIGRNGAGKTTFVRICGTQLTPTSGTARVLGRDILTETSEVRRFIGSVPQESRPLYFLNVEELVYLYLTIRGTDSKDARRRTNTILDELGLASVRKRLVNTLSGGMRRRAMVAMVLASDAEVLFLDEPTTGLDPIARREVWASISRAIKDGRTVLLTTHYLDEAEALSERLYIIERGRVLVDGTAATLKQEFGGSLRVSIPDGGRLAETVQSFGSVLVDGGTLHVITTPERLPELMGLAVREHLSATVGPVTLEEAFLKVVGRSIDVDE
jgi:ABC-2 type transport system ATP-binding protein